MTARIYSSPEAFKQALEQRLRRRRMALFALIALIAAPPFSRQV